MQKSENRYSQLLLPRDIEALSVLIPFHANDPKNDLKRITGQSRDLRLPITDYLIAAGSETAISEKTARKPSEFDELFEFFFAQRFLFTADELHKLKLLPEVHVIAILAYIAKLIWEKAPSPAESVHRKLVLKVQKNYEDRLLEVLSAEVRLLHELQLHPGVTQLISEILIARHLRLSREAATALKDQRTIAESSVKNLLLTFLSEKLPLCDMEEPDQVQSFIQEVVVFYNQTLKSLFVNTHPSDEIDRIFKDIIQYGISRRLVRELEAKFKIISEALCKEQPV